LILFHFSFFHPFFVWMFYSGFYSCSSSFHCFLLFFFIILFFLFFVFISSFPPCLSFIQKFYQIKNNK
jgi:hypothetical protein